MPERFMDLDGGLHATDGPGRTELKELETLTRQFAQVRDAHLMRKHHVIMGTPKAARAKRKPRVFGQGRD